MCVLNSFLINIFYKLHYTDKNVKPSVLKQIPIKQISLSEQQPFIEKADQMLDMNKKLHGKIEKFLNRVEVNLGTAESGSLQEGNKKEFKITKKLEKFYEFEFGDFVKELKKQKIKLSLSQQDEREEYFGDYKKVVVELKSQIDKTDEEIDEMVFDLYGLSEEEREIVKGG